MNDIVTELNKTLQRDFPEVKRPLAVEPMKPLGKEPTLVEQWGTLTKIGDEIRDRIRKEKLALRAEYEQRVVQIENDHLKKVDDAMAKLDKERVQAREKLAEELHGKLYHYELIGQKIDAG